MLKPQKPRRGSLQDLKCQQCRGVMQFSPAATCLMQAICFDHNTNVLQSCPPRNKWSIEQGRQVQVNVAEAKDMAARHEAAPHSSSSLAAYSRDPSISCVPECGRTRVLRLMVGLQLGGRDFWRPLPLKAPS
eukprot:1480489-Amphidinium_carterae.2